MSCSVEFTTNTALRQAHYINNNNRNWLSRRIVNRAVQFHDKLKWLLFYSLCIILSTTCACPLALTIYPLGGEPCTIIASVNTQNCLQSRTPANRQFIASISNKPQDHGNFLKCNEIMHFPFLSVFEAGSPPLAWNSHYHLLGCDSAIWFAFKLNWTWGRWLLWQPLFPFRLSEGVKRSSDPVGFKMLLL